MLKDNTTDYFPRLHHEFQMYYGLKTIHLSQWDVSFHLVREKDVGILQF